MDKKDVSVVVALLGAFLFFGSLVYIGYLKDKEYHTTLRICLENVKDADKCYRE